MRAKHRSERGSGLISSLLGTVMFLGFVALAVNVVIGLYATSVTSAVTTDAVNAVAATPQAAREQAVAAADQRVHAKLGNLHDVRTEWSTRADGAIGLHVSAARPTFLPRALLPNAALRNIDRTAWAHAEDLS